MKRNLTILLLLALLLGACTSEDAPVKPSGRAIIEHEPVKALRPFPQAVNFKGCIKPNVGQDQLNADVLKYYKSWLTSYVRASNGGTPGGGYYVKMQGTGGDGSEITTSEAHGYGMIIFALMAGQDAEAKKYFDGMLNMFYQHYSSGNSKCMSWVIHESEQPSYRRGSATDGDMDIAYALLLADKQWGSDGAIDYLQMARDVIAGLKESCISASSKRILLGDWDNDQYSTRSSDWMTGHMRSFYRVTADQIWLDAADEAYSVIEAITSNYSADTGLMPDFVVGISPKPAPEFFLDEYKQTNHYSWNACRYPWRISADYMHFGSGDAKNAMTKLMDFMVKETQGEPANMRAGYQLDGKAIVDYSSGAFIAPIVTASATDARYQAFLNAGWDWLNNNEHKTYYSDSITLLNMLMISGNWWNPME